jgi:hypothetical protein
MWRNDGRTRSNSRAPAGDRSSGPVVTLGALRSIIGSHRSAAVPPARRGSWGAQHQLTAYQTVGIEVELAFQIRTHPTEI